MKTFDKGFLVWFTGLPCAGKTTLAVELKKKLNELGYQRVEHLDGDILRSDLSSDLTFSKEDRRKNLLRVSFISGLLIKHDIGVLATFVSPYREVRDEIRAKIGNFVEVYVSTPVEVCENRDVKGLYKKARNGEIKDFTGVNDPYEFPEAPEIEINTSFESTDDSIMRIIRYLEEKGYITKK